VNVTPNATGDCRLLFGWSGHVAASADWGAGKGATSISGSPFHMRILGVDQVAGQTGGNQDRSVSLNAIVSPPTITTQTSLASASSGTGITDTATFTGASGAVTGTATFFVCGPSATPPDCSTGG